MQNFNTTYVSSLGNNVKDKSHTQYKEGMIQGTDVKDHLAQDCKDGNNGWKGRQ